MLLYKAVSGVTNADSNIENEGSELEAALDKADRLAEGNNTRLTHEEVFGNLRRSMI